VVWLYNAAPVCIAGLIHNHHICIEPKPRQYIKDYNRVS